VPDAVGIVGRDGRILFVNTQAQALFGYLLVEDEDTVRRLAREILERLERPWPWPSGIAG